MSDSADKKVDHDNVAPQKEEPENIFMFIPNLIGYARIVLAIISFWFMPTNHMLSGKVVRHEK